MPQALTVDLPGEVGCVLAPYDAGSRFGGVGGGVASWLAMTEGSRLVYLERDSAEVLPMRVRRRVGGMLDSGRRPLVLGGDHTLTWYALESVVERVGPVTVVHFDAHHDAYRSNILNHYTVFHHARRLLPVTIVPVGHRWDCEPVPPALAAEVDGPVYLTVDLDYFCPELIAGVGHAVPCSDLGHCDFAAFTASLERIRGHIVAADLVEWKGADTGCPEFLFAREVLTTVVRALCD